MKSTLTLLTLFLLSVVSALAGDPVSIQYGGNLEGSISFKGEVDIYTFSGQKDDAILIRMRDEQDVDSSLELYDPNGQLVTADYDYGGLAEIRSIVLQLNGQYEIRAYDKNHNDMGTYGISLHVLHAGDYATPINAFTSFEAEITKNAQIDMYQFEGQSGDVIYAELRPESTSFEGEFFIYNSQGHEIFHSGKKGAREIVGPVGLGQTDTYTVAILDKGGNDKDKYGFTLNTLNRHDALSSSLACDENIALSIDGLVSRQVLRIDAGADDLHMIEARSNDKSLELSMEIFDHNGAKIYSNTETCGIMSAFINRTNNPTSYLLVLFDENGNDLGDLGVQVHNINRDHCTQALGCDDYSEELSITEMAGSKLYIIEGVGQQSINAELHKTAGSGEPSLRLYSMNGNLLVENQGINEVNLFNHTFPYSGEFILVASDNVGNDTGEFELFTSGASFDVHLDECHMIYNFAPFNATHLKVESNQSNLQYSWSSGQSGSSIYITPTEDTEYYVTVSNSSGCNTVLSTFVEVQDVNCGNGNNVKISVCHINNGNGQAQQKCLSENGVWQHLNNGAGHEGCYLGTCDYQSICDPGSGLQIDDLGENNFEPHGIFDLRSKKIAQVHKVFPNPTTDIFQISIDPNQNLRNVVIFDTSGNVLLNKNYDSRTKEMQINLQDLNTAPGLYLVQINTAEKSEVHRMLFLQ